MSTTDDKAMQNSSGQLDAAASEAGSVYDGMQFDNASGSSSGAQPASGTTPAAGFQCAVCNAAITGDYYMAGGGAVCPSCQPRIAAELSHGTGSFGAALLYGALAGAVGAGVYYGISALTGYEFGLIAIVVGIVVGKAVRHGAGTRSHWIYRALGIGLTYAAIVATYIPAVMEGMDAAGPVAVVVAFVFSLIAPFFLIMEGEIMSIVILAIGLWEGWKYSQAPNISLSGPFRVGSGEAPEKAPAVA